MMVVLQVTFHIEIRQQSPSTPQINSTAPISCRTCTSQESPLRVLVFFLPLVLLLVPADAPFVFAVNRCRYFPTTTTTTAAATT